MGFAVMKWSWVVRDGHAIRCHEALEVYPFIRCSMFDVRLVMKWSRMDRKLKKETETRVAVSGL